MRSVIYDVAVSLDGFICGRDGDISAFPGEGAHVDAYFTRLASYSTVIMGRRTYEFGYDFGLSPGARAYPHMDHHIFSRSIVLPDGADVTVVRQDWEVALADIRKAKGGDIYLCGGGQFAGFVANHGALTRLRVKRAPIVLGQGVRLFEGLRMLLTLTPIQADVYESGVIFEDYSVGA